MTFPDIAFLHCLADLADAETMPRYRTDIAVDTKPKEGYTFDPVTEADREAEAAIRAEISARFEGSIVNLDANRFTAAAYRDGRKAAAITVFMGGMSRTGREISFHLSDDGATNTSNGSFFIKDDEGELAFKSLFGSFRSSQEKLVGPEEVAEQIWSAFFEPLSRTRLRLACTGGALSNVRTVQLRHC